VSLYDGWHRPEPGWTCPECGLAYDDVSLSSVGASLTDLADRYQGYLALDLADLQHRPEPNSWSALEYACHVRDSFALYRWRIDRALAEDRPTFPTIDRDAVVIELGYNDQEPALVAGDLMANCERLHDLLLDIDEPDWSRVGIREGEELTVEWLTISALHEARHHLLDVRRALGEPDDSMGSARLP
jgi:DinB family protein